MTLPELKALLEKATPAPWTTCEGGKSTVHISQELDDNFCHLVFDNKMENYSEEWCAIVNNDAKLIVALRNEVLALIARLEAAEKVCLLAYTYEKKDPTLPAWLAAWRKLKEAMEK